MKTTFITCEDVMILMNNLDERKTEMKEDEYLKECNRYKKIYESVKGNNNKKNMDLNLALDLDLDLDNGCNYEYFIMYINTIIIFLVISYLFLKVN